jgi:two-component system nitrogen regulation response regulator GlnG
MTQRIGKFEQCDAGTLFLDEIGDMPLATQAKILRVLQEGEISRVGSNSSIKTDVRIVAATNKDLWEAVGKKEFREDLFFRLNVVRLQLPPLRERLADIPALVSFFINKFRFKQPSAPSQISEDALAALQKYSWPGNVRELENCVQRALVLATGNTVHVTNLPLEISRRITRDVVPTPTPSTPTISTTEAPSAGGAPGSLTEAIQFLFEAARKDPKLKLLPFAERELIIRAMTSLEGNQVQAAKLLGITRATLRKRIEKFGIQKKLEMN